MIVEKRPKASDSLRGNNHLFPRKLVPLAEAYPTIKSLSATIELSGKRVTDRDRVERISGRHVSERDRPVRLKVSKSGRPPSRYPEGEVTTVTFVSVGWPGAETGSPTTHAPRQATRGRRQWHTSHESQCRRPARSV